MRRGLSKAFRSNLVAFDTDLGVRYATPPTFWVRVYLLWTFRNFRSLPKQVFNRHQLRLMDELMRSSTEFPRTKVDRSLLIGTVEQVRLSPLAITQLAAHEAAAASHQDVDAPSAGSAVHTSRDQQASNEQARSETLESPEPETSIAQVLTPSFSLDRKTASWVLLVVTLLLATLLVRKRMHSVGPGNRRTPGSAILAKPASSPVEIENVVMAAPHVAAAQPVSPQQIDNPQGFARGQLAPAFSRGGNQPSPAASRLGNSDLKQGPVSLASLVTPTTVPISVEPTASSGADSSDTDASLPRLAGPPQSRMVYPSYPETEQSGKVILTAVVGQDGTVKSITVISGQKIFANPALKAVKQWRYLPYEREGKRVEFQTTVGFDFRGDEVVSVSFPQL